MRLVKEEISKLSKEGVNYEPALDSAAS